MDRANEITRRELTSRPEDLALLGRFYTSLYVAEFPDPDERESLENMERYLRLKSEGWYGQNNYHILIMNAGDDLVAASISDYLADANAGVIEFLVVALPWRRRGIGGKMLAWTEETLAADAHRHSGKPLACIAAEMNNPFREGTVADNLDPFDRAVIWTKWDYRVIDFPYVQPALSENQQPVTHLVLTAKPMQPDFRTSLPAETVRKLVYGYLVWAMRIEAPEACANYQEMSDYLAHRDTVPLIALDVFIGQDSDRPFAIDEIIDTRDPAISELEKLYNHLFPPSLTSVASTEFGRMLTMTRQPDQPFDYHLWAIRNFSDGPIEGLASFFTFRGAGYGGYVGLAPSLRATGHIQVLIARIEVQMIRDGRSAWGWYIESDRKAARAAGFYELDLTYRQPPLPRTQGSQDPTGPILRLMYKPFGRVYNVPILRCDELLNAVWSIFRFVYDIAEPDQCQEYRNLKEQVSRWSDGRVRFRDG